MTQELLTNTSVATWTCPAGVTSVDVECWGAGAGGMGDNSQGDGMAGGGGGAYAKKIAVSVAPGANYTAVIGVGGAYETNGGDTYFVGNAGEEVLAKGGSHGVDQHTGGLGGTIAGSIGTTKYAGGNGWTGEIGGDNGGGGGSSAGTGADGSSADSVSGAAAPTGGGDGGRGGDTDGYSATQVGGGGGGGGSGGGIGGSGFRGQIRLTYTAAAAFQPALAVQRRRTLQGA
jgi:hypothetical protein